MNYSFNIVAAVTYRIDWVLKTMFKFSSVYIFSNGLIRNKSVILTGGFNINHGLI